MVPPRQAALGPAVIGVVLLAAAPAPSAALATLRETATAPDATAPVLALVALVAWALLAWLLLVATAATLAARGPGAAGRVADAVARRVAPVAIRRVVEVALGLTVAVGVLGAGPASAAPPAPPPAAPSLDWPSAAPAPALDWNPSSRDSTPPAAAPAVVVKPGDSLWAIAADHLPAPATDAQIAQAWPRWWAANRDAVGAAPDLIHPGLRLRPPAPS